MTKMTFLATCLLVGTSLDPQYACAEGSASSQSSQVRAYEVGERGPDHRIWKKVTVKTDANGENTLSTNTAYVELATGLNFWEDGQWKASREEFEITPQGYAVARAGQHKVVISPILNDANGAVDLQTPAGRRMRSTILGLTLHDRISGSNVLVATIKSGITGQKAAANEILYANCFDTIHADVRFTFQRGGFHQDVILREAIDPDWVEQQGCDPKTTRLEIWTEFFESPNPQVDSRVMSGITDAQLRALAAVPDVVNDDLDFGDMKMPLGRAYAKRVSGGEEGSVQVPKRWLRVDGRTFLVESMSLSELKPLFAGLPNWMPSGPSATRRAYVGGQVPSPVLLSPGTNAILTASLARAADEPGVVLDYQIVNSGGNYTFKSDTTYYVSSQIWLSGNVVFEGGTVIKYAPGANWIYVAGSVDCQTGPYRPAVFTSKDDDSVGEVIPGSTGAPAIDSQNFYLRLYALSSAKLHHLRMAYGSCGLNADGGDVVLTDAQFVHMGMGVYAASSATIKVRNILMDDASIVAFYGAGAAISAEHLTLRNSAKLGQNEWGSTLKLTNSLLVAVSNLGNIPLSTNFVTILSSSSGIFQAAGAGNSYLATSSPYRNAGTTNIDPTLLLNLTGKTTWPPTVYTNTVFSTATTFVPQATRDASAASVGPDLGYHYEPIDYLVNYCAITNATLTITNSTVVAAYLGSGGLWLQDRSSLVAVGTPNQPIQFTYYNTAQEQPIFLSSTVRSNFTSAILINSYHYGAVLPDAPSGTFRFAKFTGLVGAGVPFSHQAGNWEFGGLLVQDCEFGSVYGSLTFAPTTNTVTAICNNLFVRTAVKVTAQDGALCTLSNNLFWGSNSITMRPVSGSGSIYAFNNAFDASVINVGIPGIAGTFSNNYNAYIKCAGSVPLTNSGPNNVVLTNALSYQAGSFGSFYQPVSSPLINAGSLTNAAWAGLYHYTTTTNQVKETNSTVDIGYHYVSANANGGVLLDSDGDGIPDYLDADSDGDGLPDSWEIQYFGNLNQTGSGDFDGDGLTNAEEYQYGWNPANADQDGNGVVDGKDDWDGDLLINEAELHKYLTDPLNSKSTVGQTVSDAVYKLSTREVGLYEASPTLMRLEYAVADGQYTVTLSGATPGRVYEVLVRYIPASGPWTHYQVWFRTNAPATGTITRTIPAIPPPGYVGQLDVAGLGEDSDGDGLSDVYEVEVTHTHPDNPDTDGDGINDGAEDPDGDGLPNVAEYHFGTDPNQADSISDADHDGLTDTQEGFWGTDPTTAPTWQVWVGAPKQQSNLP